MPSVSSSGAVSPYAIPLFDQRSKTPPRRAAPKPTDGAVSVAAAVAGSKDSEPKTVNAAPQCAPPQSPRPQRPSPRVRPKCSKEGTTQVAVMPAQSSQPQSPPEPQRPASPQAPQALSSLHHASATQAEGDVAGAAVLPLRPPSPRSRKAAAQSPRTLSAEIWSPRRTRVSVKKWDAGLQLLNEMRARLDESELWYQSEPAAVAVAVASDSKQAGPLSLREGPEGLLKTWASPRRPQSTNSCFSRPRSPYGKYKVAQETYDCTEWKRLAPKWGLVKKIPGGSSRVSSPSREANCEDRWKPGGAVSQELLRALRRSKHRGHARWAAAAFKTFDLDHNGLLNRAELATAAFSECIRDCLGAHFASESKDMGSLVQFVLRRADKDGDNELSSEEFEEFTWHMKHMTSDVDFEAQYVFALFDPDEGSDYDFSEFERFFNFQSRCGQNSSRKEYIAFILKELAKESDGSALGSCGSKSDLYLDGPAELPKDAYLQVSPDVRRASHRDWALEAFARLDADGIGCIARGDLTNERCLAVLCECLPGRPLDTEGFLNLVDFLLKKVTHNGNYPVKADEFEALTWKLKRLDLGAQALPKKSRKGNVMHDRDQQQKLFWYLRRRRRTEHARWAWTAFKTLDVDGNGILNHLELHSERFLKCIRSCLGSHLPEEHHMGTLVKFVLGHADEDGDRRIDFKEFEKFTWRVNDMTSEADLETEFMFALFDQNRDAKLDFTEFERLFNFHSVKGRRNSSREYIESIMKELDEDHSGSITPAEYSRWSNACGGLEEAASPPPAEVLVPFEKQKAAHKSWAKEAFSRLRPKQDTSGNGYISSQEFVTEPFLAILHQCLPGQKVALETIAPLVDFVLKKSSAEGYYRISLAEFSLLTWKLKRMDADNGAPRSVSKSSSKVSVTRSSTPKRSARQGRSDEKRNVHGGINVRGAKSPSGAKSPKTGWAR